MALDTYNIAEMYLHGIFHLRREEMNVMNNLRKKVPACELERRPPDERAAAIRREQQLSEQQAMLSKVCNRPSSLSKSCF